MKNDKMEQEVLNMEKGLMRLVERIYVDVMKEEIVRMRQGIKSLRVTLNNFLELNDEGVQSQLNSISETLSKVEEMIRVAEINVEGIEEQLRR